MRQEWQLPFSLRQINDREPAIEGPSCAECAKYQADRLDRAEACPMLTAPGSRRPYRSPHASTYWFEARYSRWACTQGSHGAVFSLY